MRYRPMRIQDAVPTTAVVLLAVLVSCDGDDDPPVGVDPPHVETRVIRDVDYIKNTFFLIDAPEAFFGAFPYSVEVFVTVTPEDLVADPGLIAVPAWAVTDSTGEGGMISLAVEALEDGFEPFNGLHGDVRQMEKEHGVHAADHRRQRGGRHRAQDSDPGERAAHARGSLPKPARSGDRDVRSMIPSTGRRWCLK